MRTYKEPKTGRWYIDYFFRGERIRYKAGSSQRAADRLRLRIESEINAGKHNPVAVREEVRGGGKGAATLGGLVQAFLGSYKSRGGTDFYRSRAKAWLTHFGVDTPLSQIGPLQVEQFKNERGKVVGAGTVRQDLISLGTMFRWAMGKGLASENPADPIRVRRPPAPHHREVFLSDDQVKHLLECCPRDIRRLVAWLVETGMRLGEPLKLRWKDLDAPTGWVYVHPGKTGKPRRIPYTVELQAIAGSAPRHLRSELVFCDAQGAPLQNYEASKQIKAAMIRAGIKDASAHTLRHTFASRLAARGVPMKAIADLLGQNVATTTARYMHLQPQALRAAMESLRKPLYGNDVAMKESDPP
jgi:integrase